MTHRDHCESGDSFEVSSVAGVHGQFVGDGDRRDHRVKGPRRRLAPASPQRGRDRTERSSGRSIEWQRFEVPIQRFVDEGLLEKSGDFLRLTRQGVLLSNEVFAEFIL